MDTLKGTWFNIKKGCQTLYKTAVFAWLGRAVGRGSKIIKAWKFTFKIKGIVFADFIFMIN